MIVAEPKPLDEIMDFIAPYKKVMVLGCGGCVSVCLSGGDKEVGVLAASINLRSKKEGKEVEVKVLHLDSVLGKVS